MSVENTQVKEQKRESRPKRPSLMSAVWSLVPKCMLEDRVAISKQLRQIQRRRQRDPERLKKLKARAERSAKQLQARRDNALKVSYPEDLPISMRKDEIVKAIKENPVVVVAGETGSGKTTQLPKMCLDAGLGVEAKIACT